MVERVPSEFDGRFVMFVYLDFNKCSRFTKQNDLSVGRHHCVLSRFLIKVSSLCAPAAYSADVFDSVDDIQKWSMQDFRLLSSYLLGFPLKSLSFNDGRIVDRAKAR